jgi:glyoxylase-like metal-dependent hydrolase (beta-lactamase superfamily II)
MADLPPKAWLAMVDSLTGEARKEMDFHLGTYFDFSGLTPITPTETFNGSLRFSVGDEQVEVFEGRMSHTRSDSLVHVPGKSFAHMGDITVPDSIQQLQYPGMKNLLEDFDVLIKWDAKYYLPGHGRLMTLADVRTRVEHCLWLQDQVKRRYDKGMALAAATDDLTRNLGPYKSYTNVVGLYWTVKMLYAEFRGDLDEYARRNYPTYLATSRRLKLEFPKRYPELSAGKF